MTDLRPRLDSTALEQGKILWDYLRVSGEPGMYPGTAADRLIMVLGSPDLSVARHAADLLTLGVAEHVVVSGGCRIQGSQDRLEADVLGDLITRYGVSADRVILERRSLNTSDHFWKTKGLLASRPYAVADNPPRIVVLVPSPIAERRALETGRWRWPGSAFWVDGVPVTYDNYLDLGDSTAIVGRMVGEIERILAYPGRGYMRKPDRPPSRTVVSAYDWLREDFNSRPVPDSAGKRALAVVMA